MGSLVLPIQIKRNGALADADSTPVLSDSTAAYGVRRADTQTAIVAAGTAMSHDGTGLYSYTLADPIAGITYEWVAKVIIDAQTIYVPRSTVASGIGAGYLPDLDAANLMANSRSGLAAWKAASSSDQSLAAQLASERIDAVRFQGRKYDPAQVLEFPRAWGSFCPIDLSWPSGLARLPEVWDWDSVNNVAIVPLNVQLACLFEADAILAGTAAARDARLQAIADGLASQSVGGLSESYFDPYRPGAGGGAEQLSLGAARLLSRYVLRSGRIV